MGIDKYGVWLAFLYDIGTSGVDQLLNAFETPAQIYYAKDKEFKERGIPNHITAKVLSLKKRLDIDDVMNYMKKTDIGFIPITSSLYPKPLKTINDAPYGLFIIGELPEEELVKISVIGTRKCSDYGKSAAFNISRDISLKDAVVISGMAEGIDSAAHRGALAAGGYTLAVLAGGVDVCYPFGNQTLYNKIKERGAIISELPPKAGIKPWLFPRRNRIISGLADAVLVVEAPMKSGALITAGFALNQGREVLAVPGSIFSMQSAGPNALIKDGAFPVTKAQDVFDAIGIIEGDDDENEISKSTKDKDSAEAAENKLAPDEKLIYDCIGLEPVSLDEILGKTDIKVQIAQYILTKLELRGEVVKLPGLKYMRRGR